MSEDSKTQVILRSESELVEQTAARMAAQHPLHALIFSAMPEVMKRNPDYIVDFALSSPNRYMTLLTKLTPGLVPQQGMQGDITLHVHQSLVPTDLDE